MAEGENIGRKSSPEAFEIDESVTGGQVGGNGDFRGLPAMRSDVKWHIGKHGAG